MEQLLRTSGLALVTLVWAAILGLSPSPEAVLFTIPVFMLAAPLAFGRRPGERLIERLCAPRTRARTRRSHRAVPALPAEIVPASPLGVRRLCGRAPPFPC